MDNKKCGRPPCKNSEYRIDGYCSIYCRDIHDLEVQLAEAQASAKEDVFNARALSKKYYNELAKARDRMTKYREYQEEQAILLGNCGRVLRKAEHDLERSQKQLDGAERYVDRQQAEIKAITKGHKMKTEYKNRLIKIIHEDNHNHPTENFRGCTHEDCISLKTLFYADLERNQMKKFMGNSYIADAYQDWLWRETGGDA